MPLHAQGLVQRHIPGRKRIGPAQHAHGDVLGRPVANTGQSAQRGRGAGHVGARVQGQRAAKYVETTDPHDATKKVHTFDGFEQLTPGKMSPQEYDSNMANKVLELCDLTAQRIAADERSEWQELLATAVAFEELD